MDRERNRVDVEHLSYIIHRKYALIIVLFKISRVMSYPKNLK